METPTARYPVANPAAPHEQSDHTVVVAPAPEAGAQQAQEAEHSPAEGSDADVLMGEVAADAEDVAAEPVVSGVPFSMQEPGGRRKWNNARRNQSRKRRKRVRGGEG